MTAVTKSSLRLYRDCLRAIRHASARSPKAAAMTELVRDEFRKHKDVQSFDKINQLKQAAWEGIQNYVVLRSFAISNPDALKREDWYYSHIQQGIPYVPPAITGKIDQEK